MLNATIEHGIPFAVVAISFGQRVFVTTPPRPNSKIPDIRASTGKSYGLDLDFAVPAKDQEQTLPKMDGIQNIESYPGTSGNIHTGRLWLR